MNSHTSCTVHFMMTGVSSAWAPAAAAGTVADPVSIGVAAANWGADGVVSIDSSRSNLILEGATGLTVEVVTEPGSASPPFPWAWAVLVPLCDDGDETWSVEFCLAARAQSTLQKRFRFILLRSSGLPQISQLPMSGPPDAAWELGFCGGASDDCWWLGEMGELDSVVLRFFGGSSPLSLSGYRWRCTGNGSGASCITYPSITCVNTFGLIIAFGSPPLSVAAFVAGGKLLLLVLVVAVTAVAAVAAVGVGDGVAWTLDVVIVPLAVAAADVVVKLVGIELAAIVEVGSVVLLAAAVDVVVLTAPADESSEVGGWGPPAVWAGWAAVGVGVDAAGGIEEASPASVAAAAVTADAAAASIGVVEPPFNCASEALSGAAEAGTAAAESAKKTSV